MYIDFLRKEIVCLVLAFVFFLLIFFLFLLLLKLALKYLRNVLGKNFPLSDDTFNKKYDGKKEKLQNLYM